MSRIIRISAAVVVDENARALVVRKRGATCFQQPGGKPDPGENAVDALLRELGEEIGVRPEATDLIPLGVYRAPAANEPGHTVVADAFRVRIRHEQARAAAEIEEMRWVSEPEIDDLPLAPLSRTYLIRQAWD